VAHYSAPSALSAPTVTVRIDRLSPPKDLLDVMHRSGRTGDIRDQMKEKRVSACCIRNLKCHSAISIVYCSGSGKTAHLGCRTRPVRSKGIGDSVPVSLIRAISELSNVSAMVFVELVSKLFYTSQ